MSARTLLVANRGEIARRVFRTARAMGLRCVAVYADDDAEAPFVTEADEAVRLPGGYLEGKAILDAARATGAGMLHPGYGFLAENAGFAADVQAAGLTWVGPSPDAIARMGDKIAAKALAAEAGVPILPGAAEPSEAQAVGFPLLVKAAAGGGGKGMRVVASAEELADAVAGARREAKAAFGDDRVFLERFLPRCRHVEIQILGDRHGARVHLGERECSIQRRHQKILEEAPSPRVDAALREAMGDAALRLAAALSYESAGTVEFLLDDATGEFFFLEANTRLQVEHPVTEAVTGIDLVREQLRIAAGEPLGYGQDAVRMQGAAIEARLYAEDPAAGFLPATGRLVAFEPSDDPVVRWDAGVAPGSVVGTQFDPMLAKVIAHAATRAEAAGRLALALERAHLGGVETNRDFLAATLRSDAFLAGDTTTDFIERVEPPRALVLDETERVLRARIAALWLQGVHRAEAGVLRQVPSGWRNARLPAQRLELRHGEETLEVAYRSERGGGFRFETGEGERVAARVHAWSPSGLDAEVGGRRRRTRVSRAGDLLVIGGPGGDVALRLVPRFPPPHPEEATGGLVAPMPGKVIELRVAAGDAVRAGDVVVVLEAMKMELPMKADVAGVVSELRVAVGEQVEKGALLLAIEPASGASEGGA